MKFAVGVFALYLIVFCVSSDWQYQQTLDRQERIWEFVKLHPYLFEHDQPQSPAFYPTPTTTPLEQRL